MRLDYLDFDYSEDADGAGTFDALAATAPARHSAVLAEVCAVLDWAHAAFPDQRGALDDGGDWDYALQGLRELSAADALHYDAQRHSVSVRAQPPVPVRLSVSLTVTGSAAFCAALREHFELP